MEYKFAEYSKQDRVKFIELGNEIVDSDACHKYGDIQRHLHNAYMSTLYKYNKKDKFRYLLVCYDNGKPIGSILVINSLFHIFNDLVFEIHLYVSKEYRRRNVANDMLNHLLNITDLQKRYLYSKGALEPQGEIFYLKHGIHFLNFELYAWDIYRDWQKKKYNIKTAKEEIKRRLDKRYDEPDDCKEHKQEIDGYQTIK